VLLYGAYALGTGALALLYVIGIYAILYGILEIWLSLLLRGHATFAMSAFRGKADLPLELIRVCY